MTRALLASALCFLSCVGCAEVQKSADASKPDDGLGPDASGDVPDGSTPIDPREDAAVVKPPDGGEQDAGADDGGPMPMLDADLVDATEPPDDGATPDTPDAGPPVVNAEKLAALCEASPQSYVTYDGAEELTDLLVGEWIDCRDSTGFHAEQDGVAFEEDGSWAALFVDEAGAVRVGAGVDETGEWDIYMEPDPGPQPALISVRGHILRPVFTQNPTQLREADENDFLERYVRLQDVIGE